MKNKKSIRKNHAVAGVIEALLMVALVAIIISIIQLQYIPDIMEQKEAEHMDQVSNQFSYLKSMIDIQSATNSDVPMFTMITLGSRELPYLITAGSSGELEIVEDNSSRISVTKDPDIDNYSVNLTSIKYQGNNIYFVKQTYALEGGGLFVKQPSGNSTMRADPPIYPTTPSNKVILHFNLTKIVCYKNRSYTGGFGKCFVRTNYSHTNPPEYYDPTYAITKIMNATIYTDYPNAWHASLNDTIGDFVYVNLTSSGSSKYVTIEEKSDPVYVYFSERVIYTQIGLGWVK